MLNQQQAKLARRALDAIYRLEPKIEYGIKIELDIISQFIDSAIKQLPEPEEPCESDNGGGL